MKSSKATSWRVRYEPLDSPDFLMVWPKGFLGEHQLLFAGHFSPVPSKGFQEELNTMIASKSAATQSGNLLKGDSSHLQGSLGLIGADACSARCSEEREASSHARGYLLTERQSLESDAKGVEPGVLPQASPWRLAHAHRSEVD